MPAGYEKMRDEFMQEGMSRAAAEAKAARIWNAKHPNDPVGKHKKKKEQGPGRTILTRTK